VTVVAMALAACQGDGADKAGGGTVVLQLATIDSVNNNGQSFGPQAFVDALSEVSDGRLRVEVIEAYGDGRADAESKLVEAIAAGDIDGGWPSTRAFANAGISGLEVVEAPMTITSYEAQKALVTSPLAEELLSRLEGSGLVGLGLAVGPLRRPFAARSPLLALDDWEGTPFRVYNSPVQDAAMRALDAEPVNVGFTWMDEVEAGTLRGAEFDIAQYHANAAGTVAGNVTSNVVLWPKVFVLSLNQERFDALTDEQRGWVEEAAAVATQASVDAAYDESSLARELCDVGVRFVAATEAQVADLRAAFQPVIDGLAAGGDASLLEGIQAIVAENPGVEQPEVPSECTEGVANAGSEAAGVAEGIPDIPEGTYRVELTEDEVFDAVHSNEAGWSGTWTLTIDDGTWALGCHPIDSSHDCGNTGDIVQDDPFEAGDLRGDSVAHLIGNAEVMASMTDCEKRDECFGELSYELEWELDGDTLRFTDAPGGIDDPYTFVIEPWTRID
jgi:TRAP-type C4-dicarboxylate transport system substrate-binding protein